jgi:sterol desaturase/sphingolipid hydroxylase (fatty acid hydroxylase superfamily)
MRVLRPWWSAFSLGVVAWTLTEYGLHRFAMHVPRGRGMASAEHLRHHAEVTYFSPASKKIASAVGTSAVAFPVARAVAGPRRAVAFVVGLIVTYSLYEFAHRRLHTHAPRTAYGRWMRRHHLHHHFGAPMRNFGVTTPLWDRVFGTSRGPGTVSVPRRFAPVWLLDEAGEMCSAFAADYRVTGVPTTSVEQAHRDRDDAFGNVPPAA